MLWPCSSRSRNGPEEAVEHREDLLELVARECLRGDVEGGDHGDGSEQEDVLVEAAEGVGLCNAVALRSNSKEGMILQRAESTLQWRYSRAPSLCPAGPLMVQCSRLAQEEAGNI